MNYRREIDGLRALAVLPVILFHAGFSFFSGGFIGVDVFFVISGYLITLLLIGDLERANFSLKRFYARRARRILPALFAVMFACIPIAFLWMLPSQYADFSRSMIPVVLFVSNIFFWRESGYFAAEASEKPLLHTWSLGVEEQYYLFFPMVLMLLWRFGKQRAFYVVAALGLLSLIACEYGSRYAPVANFFLIPTRAWELLAGSLCAFISTRHTSRKQGSLALLGLGLIVASMALFNEHHRLPSAYMLLPVLGTALVLLHGHEGTLAARILSYRPCVAIGLISYSAYLWHHPLFAFARIRIPTTPETPTMLALILASLVLGAITWRWVEQPFRNRRHAGYIADKPALIAAGASGLLLLLIAVWGYTSHGRFEYWKNHATTNQLRAFELLEAAKKQPRFFDNGDCIYNIIELTQETENRLLACQKKYGEGIAVIGDSHAINLFYVLKHGWKKPFLVGISQAMCRPHTPRATCYYDRFLALLEKHPRFFSHIIYKQAGFHLLQDAYGRDVERRDISGLSLNAAVPDFVPNIAYIDAVKGYLEALAQHSDVIWQGPRIEPHIRESVIVQHGCNYTFDLRPNQRQVFQRLDRAIGERLKGSSVEYQSQLAIMKFDMKKDFMTCEKTYFIDGDHYSTDGEERFGERLTLQLLVSKGGARGN